MLFENINDSNFTAFVGRQRNDLLAGDFRVQLTGDAPYSEPCVARKRKAEPTKQVSISSRLSSSLMQEGKTEKAHK
jgi:hypothetical protein